jgi:hypothetical protein
MGDFAVVGGRADLCDELVNIVSSIHFGRGRPAAFTWGGVGGSGKELRRGLPTSHFCVSSHPEHHVKTLKVLQQPVEELGFEVLCQQKVICQAAVKSSKGVNPN